MKQQNLIGVIFTFKKLLCLGMALVLTAGLAACGKKVSSAEAYQMYTEAANLVNTSTGLDLGVSTAITISQDNLADYTTYNTSLQRQESNAAKQMDVLFTMSQQGQTSENEYTIDGDNTYIISQGQYKEVEQSLVEKYTEHCKMFAITQDAVTKVKTGKKEGNPSYTMTLDPAKSEELVKSHLNSYQMSTDSIQIEPKEVQITLITNKSGAVDQILLNYLLSATQQGSDTSQELSASTTYKIVASGNAVSVNMPDFSTLTRAEEDSSTNE